MTCLWLVKLQFASHRVDHKTDVIEAGEPHVEGHPIPST